MEYELCEPARTFNMVPVVILCLLAIMIKFSNAGYAVIFDEDEVNIYDLGTAESTTPRKPILKGW